MTSKTQLFLLPFAGGNCYSYNFLEKGLVSDFEVHALELPGRGKRMAESLHFTAEAAVEDYLNQIQKLRTNAPFLVYGHSMGSLLGLAVVASLEERKDSALALVVSGNAGPGVGLDRNVHKMSDEEFKNEMRELGGVPEEILVNQELFDFFTPAIRSDFEILEKGGPWLEARVSCPIHVMLGDQERDSLEREGWAKVTNQQMTFELLSGKHFFIMDHAEKLIQLLKSSKNGSLVV